MEEYSTVSQKGSVTQITDLSIVDSPKKSSPPSLYIPPDINGKFYSVEFHILICSKIVYDKITEAIQNAAKYQELFVRETEERKIVSSY